MTRRLVSGRWKSVLVMLLLVWAWGCQSDRTDGADEAGDKDRFEGCDHADEVLSCQREFIEDRGIEACWEGRSAEARCVILGMTMLEDESACEEKLQEVRGFPRAIPSCREIHGETPADEEAFDRLYVQVVANWVGFELDDHGELELVLRFLQLRPGFTAAIVGELNESQQRYLRSRDAIRELLAAERVESP